MCSSYDMLVEEIKKLSFEEKMEIKFLLEKYLIEERREEIFRNYQESMREEKSGKLKFSSDIDELKSQLNQIHHVRR
ncbi:hypothetical protein ISS30_02555 [bacterium]|nr:hypothetical protein [bacterium]